MEDDALVNSTEGTSEIRIKEASFVLNIVIGSGLLIFGLLGLLATILLIKTLIHYDHVRKEGTFVIMLSLALSDSGHLLLVIGHVGPELFGHESTWGEVWEGLVTHSNLLFWYASLGSYNLMALNRFFTVCRHEKVGRVFSIRRTLVYCEVSWFFALLLSLTPLTVLCCRKIFDIHWDTQDVELSNEWNNHLKIVTIALNWLTVVVMFACYGAVFNKFRSSVVPQARNSQERRQQSENERVMRDGCYQFLLISLIFTLLLCFQVATQLSWKPKIVITILQLLYTSNHAINPLIYLAINKTLRREMLDTVRCRKVEGHATGKAHSGTKTEAPTPTLTYNGSAAYRWRVRMASRCLNRTSTTLTGLEPGTQDSVEMTPVEQIRRY